MLSRLSVWPIPPDPPEGRFMSSPFRAGAMLIALLTLAGCQRDIEERKRNPLEAAERGAAFEDNASHIAQGRRLYGGMSCAGCHGRGASGGLGPPLADDDWRYGGSMAEIAATILDGRPNGMPAFRNRISEEQAWQLAAFVRSLSAPRRQDSLPGRSDLETGQP